MTDKHPTQFNGVVPTPAWAFGQYQRLLKQLPAVPPHQGRTLQVTSLETVAPRFDAFVFDAFGVLNSGPAAIPGAVERIAWLQGSGKPVMVLSNAATASHPALEEKYRRLGFDLTADQIVSSRWLLENALAREPRQGLWGVIAPPRSDTRTLPQILQRAVRAGITDRQMDLCDGFIFLSSEDWTETLQEQLEASLNRRPRPLDVANPDLVAPRGDGLTLEPGFFAHRVRETTGVRPHFFGKPYSPAFAEVLSRLPGVSPQRVLMVGDTLHTDILGARAAGLATALVSDHGALAGMDVDDCIRQSGIIPDFLMPAI